MPTPTPTPTPQPAAHHVPLPGTQAPLPGSEAILVGLAALAVLFVPFLWPLARHFAVMAHEGAHAVTGSILGFTVSGVRLNRDATGGTHVDGLGGVRGVLVTFAGYLGPSAFGLAAAKLISQGQIVTVLWLAVLLLVMLLLLIRKSFGIVSVPVAIVVLGATIRYSHTGLEVVIAYGMVWVLLLAGVRVAVLRGANASDAHALRQSTHVPRHLWALLWLAGTLWAVAVGGSLLVLGQ